MSTLLRLLLLLVPAILLQAPDALAESAGSGSLLAPAGIRIEFLLFGATLFSVAYFHHYSMQAALIGLAILIPVKLAIGDFDMIDHIEHELPILLNLLGLLLGFAILARHVENSRLPLVAPDWLPDGYWGALSLLAFIMLLSSFLDNIAAAIIGGTIANAVFKGRVHIGYLAAIVAASNAGGSGSVVGDTTTTMMWVAGISWLAVVEATLGALVAFLIFGTIGAWQQNRYQEIVASSDGTVTLDRISLLIVGMMLAGAVLANILCGFPALGVWIAIVAGSWIRPVPWTVLTSAVRGTVFLMSLVLAASLMPIAELPLASWQSTFCLGLLSAVFDNIPLTKLALQQGGYDWGFLAYAVGFGGSITWFGSSAGVALSNSFQESRSLSAWMRAGWHVPLAYLAGFFVMLGVLGWHPIQSTSNAGSGIVVEH